jgi:hypothetical protein
MSEAEIVAKPETYRMPMFYRTPTVLNVQAHGHLALTRKRNYSFCAKVNSVPVVLSEVPYLIQHYPVAFTPGDEPMLMAIVGARNDENLFVDEAGNWEPGKYIPAYVRRFPFVLMERADKDFMLAAELESGFFGAEGDRLFENGRPTQYAADVFRFCIELQQAFKPTQEFCQAVHKKGLLKQKRSTMTTPSGRTFSVSGFAGVDVEDLNQLDNRTANIWRKEGWLATLYWHVGSLGQLKSYPIRLDEALAAMPGNAAPGVTVRAE